jgi:hypothetical protein
VRRTASRRHELEERELHIDEALRLLRLAKPVEFDFTDQADRWRAWETLDAHDPEEIPDGPQHETAAQRQRRESRSAEDYAKRVLIPVDRETGVQFVPAGWLQRFMGMRLGSGTTPHRARQALLSSGWQVRGRDGRIKATEPGGERDLALVLYLVPAGWAERQAGEV